MTITIRPLRAAPERAIPALSSRSYAIPASPAFTLPGMSGARGRAPAMSAQQTATVSVGVAAVLVALKLGVGLGTHSLGLISAGIESSGDVVAAGVTVFAVRLAGRPADRGHPYGHRRAENLGALGEAAILLAGAIVVTVEALRRLILGGTTTDVRWFQFAILGVAIVLDVTRSTVSMRAAVRLNSPALRSNAWHFAADLLGSVVVLAGLLAVKGGVHDGDAIAALVVAAHHAVRGREADGGERQRAHGPLARTGAGGSRRGDRRAR